MLTPYDEFPVHQAAGPFSEIPVTDYSWDDGYWFGVFEPDSRVFFGTGLRVNPNTDMVGGYAMLNVAGRQFTVRFNRCWRPSFDLSIGPYRIDFVEPLRVIRLRLADNDSELRFDLTWEGTSPPFLEGRHVARNRGRATTNQSRYSQPGKASGWIQLRDQRYEVDAERWSGSRDHSWGLYAERQPLAPQSRWLPPRESEGPQRSLRFWTCFRTEPYSGFYHLHETADGEQCQMNDVFGSPFGGRLVRGWDSEVIDLASGRQSIEFEPGTRIMRRATLTLEDSDGREWEQSFDVASPPWIPQTLGYHPGSWKDGGTFHTFHGSEELALEWDEFDFSEQPFDYSPYAMPKEAAEDNFNMGSSKGGMIHGPEYLARVTTRAPDGSVSVGAAQVEMFITGAYRPYGFE